VENRRKAILGPPKPIEQAGDGVETEPVADRRKLCEAVELCLDGRIIRPREVGHQAAFFSGER
jgi:hypothetical protein